MSETTTVIKPTTTGERAELLTMCAKARQSVRIATRDLSDEEAGRRTTASELCLGGLVKHVTAVEQMWANFLVDGRSAIPDFASLTEADWAQHADQFRMLPGETLAGLLAAYDEAGRRTDELVTTLPDMDATMPLPEGPWFTDQQWSVRRVLLHIMIDTAQHAGHADIIREALDGKKSTDWGN
ncbi:DinB family protein [Streptomyces sp. NPDC001185]|uniref:DinB family protein n=1 Tax=Streptomyces sp. NPDC001185 TaxID=3154380 RepID=UPI0033330FD8